MKKSVFLFLLVFLGLGLARAQVNVKDSAVFAPMVLGAYSFQFPGGDLADRFGPNSSIGAGFYIKNKHNWIYGADGSFLFGGNVREDSILDPLRSSQGDIINEFGELANVVLLERGFIFNARAGKLFSVLGPNPNSGIFVLGGVGLLQHKIRIQDNNNTAAPLRGDLKKGYDRLSNGLALSQYIGYQYMGNTRVVNFFAGFEFIQAFTKNRRSYNFDTMEKDETERFDMLYGFRVGWILPLYKRVPREYYYR